MLDGLDALHEVLLCLGVRVQGFVLRHGRQVTAGLLVELEEKNVLHHTGTPLGSQCQSRVDVVLGWLCWDPRLRSIPL